jgi:hypothetical protein
MAPQDRAQSFRINPDCAGDVARSKRHERSYNFSQLSGRPSPAAVAARLKTRCGGQKSGKRYRVNSLMQHGRLVSNVNTGVGDVENYGICSKVSTN